MDEIKQIGKKLKQGRMEKGYTLEEVQQLTKIQKRYLIAIEENRLEDLPSDFFIKTLIHQYAEVLNIKVDPILSKGSVESQSEGIPEEVGALSRVEMKKESKRKRFAYQIGTPNRLPTFLMTLFVFLIVGMIWWYVYYLNEKPDFTTSPSDTNQSQMAASITHSNESSSFSDGKPSISVEEKTDFEVNYIIRSLDLPSVLTLETDDSGRSWVNVTINDAVVFEATLEVNTVQTVEIPADLETLSIRIGYLPSTTIRLGDELMVPKPENQEVVQTQNLYFEFE